MSEPVGTITTMDRWALEETTYRMLTPHEVKLCMGFTAEYQVLGTKKEQVWQVGNAVCPPIMAEILRRCVVAITSGKEQKAA